MDLIDIAAINVELMHWENVCEGRGDLWRFIF